MSRKNKQEGIRVDLIQGKEYKIIAKKWEVSLKYIQNLASLFRKQGNDVPKQGSIKFKKIGSIVYKRA